MTAAIIVWEEAIFDIDSAESFVVMCFILAISKRFFAALTPFGHANHDPIGEDRLFTSPFEMTELNNFLQPQCGRFGHTIKPWHFMKGFCAQ